MHSRPGDHAAGCKAGVLTFQTIEQGLNDGYNAQDNSGDANDDIHGIPGGCGVSARSPNALS